MANFKDIAQVDVGLSVATVAGCNDVILAEAAGFSLNGESIAAATMPQDGKSMFEYMSSKWVR